MKKLRPDFTRFLRKIFIVIIEVSTTANFSKMVLPFSKGQCHFAKSCFYLLKKGLSKFQNNWFEAIPFSVIFWKYSFVHIFCRDLHIFCTDACFAEKGFSSKVFKRGWSPLNIFYNLVKNFLKVRVILSLVVSGKRELWLSRPHCGNTDTWKK